MLLRKVATRPPRGQCFLTGIDDSGGHAALFDIHGNRLGDPKQPYVGVAAVTVGDALTSDFKGKWNELRARIKSTLGTSAPPPVHLRWMWGNKRVEKHKNPYVNATNAQIADWLSEAVNIMAQFQRYRYEFGILTEFYARSHMQDLLIPYYTDAASRMEREFLASKHVPYRLYEDFHRATVYPLLRTLPFLLWKLDHSIKTIGGSDTAVEVDGFTGIDGVEAPDVVRAIQELANLTRVVRMSVVPSYSESPLVQAADLIAWSFNRVLTRQAFDIDDPPFFRVFGPILGKARSLGGTLIRKVAQLPPKTSASTICIVYSLARLAAEKKDADFTEAALVDVDEFHRRAMSQRVESTGISVLSDEGRRMAESHHAAKMTGPRAELAAE